MPTTPQFPGTMVMYGVGVTDWPTIPYEPTPGGVATVVATVVATDLRQHAEAVMRWYMDVTPLTRSQRAAHSKPCRLWEALRAMEWARSVGLGNVDDGELISMWLYNRSEKR